MTDRITRLPAGDLGDHGPAIPHGEHFHCPVCLEVLERAGRRGFRCDECGWLQTASTPSPAGAGGDGRAEVTG